MFCQKCGKELIEGSVFCNSCGHPVQIQGEVTNAESTVPQNNTTNKTTAIKRSKPWYKRWWIWVIAAAVLLFILAAIGSCDSESNGAFDVTTVDSGASSQPQASTAPKNLYPDEILYNGVPISKIFQTNEQEVYNLLGAPTKMQNDTYLWYQTTDGDESTGIELFYNQQGHLNNITADSMAKLSFNGTPLSGKTRAELIEILGKPNSEFEPSIPDPSCMIWEYPDYSVEMLIESLNSEDIPYGARFSNEDSKTFTADGDIGKRKTYNDDVFGNMAVTLENVEFTDCILDTDGKSYLYPDNGCVFLYITVSVENIGTKSGSLLIGWNKVVFDNSYEFTQYGADDLPNSILPMTSPVTGHIVFEVPTNVSESDKSLVLNFGDGYGNNLLSYVLR